MNECNGQCEQGRKVCTCKGLEMDYGKGHRLFFLEQERDYDRWVVLTKWVMLLGSLYFLGHIVYALYNI